MVCSSFDLPKSFFIHSNLETVILEKVSLSLEDVPLDARLVCLKSLHLFLVRFSSDESVERLLSRCRVLEDLVVGRSSFTNVMVFTIDVPTLWRLTIDNSSRPEDMPELVKASVSVVCESQPDMFLGCLEHLEICLCSSECWILLTLVLNHAPRLRVLNLNLKLEHYVQRDGMVSWNQPDLVPECLSSYLEILEWRQYKGTEQEREAAKYILANGSRLKKATFYSESAEKHVMSKELECVARDSCTFVFE
ncbi:hypothetical protein Bca4012_064749 [Brassica carinata]